MALTVKTARLGSLSALDDALDITRKSGNADGIVFAPTWSILKPVLESRADLQKVKTAIRPHDAMITSAQIDAMWVWHIYCGRYVDEMRASYKSNRHRWDKLLGRSSVTLLCYCHGAVYCHRSILARVILPRLGAVYAGEVG